MNQSQYNFLNMYSGIVLKEKVTRFLDDGGPALTRETHIIQALRDDVAFKRGVAAIKVSIPRIDDKDKRDISDHIAAVKVLLQEDALTNLRDAITNNDPLTEYDNILVDHDAMMAIVNEVYQILS